MKKPPREVIPRASRPEEISVRQETLYGVAVQALRNILSDGYDEKLFDTICFLELVSDALWRKRTGMPPLKVSK